MVLNGDGKLRFYDAYKHRKGEEFPGAIDTPELELEVGPDGTKASGIGLGPGTIAPPPPEAPLPSHPPLL